jgi:hypothetical protein
MVTATVRTTVVDDEVIPVENTPPRPPPLPEPPPFTIGFDHDYYHTDTTKNHFDCNNDFILIYAINCFKDGQYQFFYFN